MSLQIYCTFVSALAFIWGSKVKCHEAHNKQCRHEFLHSCECWLHLVLLMLGAFGQQHHYIDHTASFNVITADVF